MVSLSHIGRHMHVHGECVQNSGEIDNIPCPRYRLAGLEKENEEKGKGRKGSNTDEATRGDQCLAKLESKQDGISSAMGVIGFKRGVRLLWVFGVRMALFCGGKMRFLVICSYFGVRDSQARPN